MRWPLGIVLLAGCYAPQPPQGAPCGPSDPCPSGQQCFAGFCAIEAPGDDASPELDGLGMPGDAPVDTPPVPPMMAFGERPDAIDDTWVDTFLVAGQPGVNLGTHADLHLRGGETEPVLVRIDVSTVPGHATVIEAKLRFRVTANTIPAGTTIDVFAMNESWSEGTGNFSPGIANMTDRHPGVAWASEGAQPPSRDAAAAASTTAAALLEPGDELVLALPNALVQGWIADPDTNHGLALFVDATDFYAELGSSEFGDNARRPYLELALE